MLPIDSQSASKSLIISDSPGAALSDDQKAFNRLVLAIEHLRRQNEEITTRLDACLQYYSKKVFPKLQEIAHLRAEILKKIYPVYCEQKLINKGDKKILRQYFISELSGIAPFMKLDDELREIFEEAHGATYAEVQQQKKEDKRKAMQEMFDSEGVNIPLDDLSPEMNDEEVARKMHEYHHAVKQKEQEQNARKSAKEKSKKQRAKDAREQEKAELRTTGIGKIYKSLAKVFHPDLERDAEKIAEKEDLMKRLTAAYEQNDLHTLLHLEIEWSTKEEGKSERLSDDKVRMYNQILEEQVRELELARQTILDQPRYQPLKAYFPPSVAPSGWNEAKLKSTANEYKQYINHMKFTLKGFARNPVNEVREIIQAYNYYNR
ncbi:MAG: hypothetical protein U0264_11830 [Candidatus Kapaibacterium sp.]